MGNGRGNTLIGVRASVHSRRHRRAFRLTFSAILCIFLSACASARADLKLAKRSVEQFHRNLDSEHYRDIYAASDHTMRDKISETDFSTYLKNVHDKLGTVKTSSMLRAGVAWHSSQRATITLAYETVFTKANAKEDFIWQIANNRATLYRYVVESSELTDQK